MIWNKQQKVNKIMNQDCYKWVQDPNKLEYWTFYYIILELLYKIKLFIGNKIILSTTNYNKRFYD